MLIVAVLSLGDLQMRRGSMDTEYAHYELCVDCYMRTLRMSYQSLNFSTLEMLDNLHIESIKKLQSKK